MSVEGPPDVRAGGRNVPATGCRPRATGFTLIELMVTIALVALVAAVAYPSYVVSVQKARRAEARTALTEAAQRLERYYTDNNQYGGGLLCNLGDTGCTAASQVYPASTENGHYLLTFDPTVRSPFTYTIWAVPQRTQLSDPCGTFTLNERGERGVRDGPETDPRKCW